MAAPPDTAVRLGLVGTGAELVKSLVALKGLPAVEITVVADASDRSEGAKLAQSLKLPLVKNAMEVFRTKANIVLEVNGDERQYERLLSIKPAGVEVVSARGARLLIQLLRQAAGVPASGSAAGAPTDAAPGKSEGPNRLEPLTVALQGALRKGGNPEDAAKTLLPALAAAGGMEFAAVVVAKGDGFTWLVPSGDGAPLSQIPAAQLGQALGTADPVWLTKPAKGVGVAGLLPLRVGSETLGLLAVGRSQDAAAGPDELMALRLSADLLASALRATQPPPREGETVKEVIKEVVREVPVEVVKEVPVEVVHEVEVVKEIEVIKEVVKEVPIEVVREVVKEVPIEVIKEVVKEIPVEVIKEVVREVPVPMPGGVREIEVIKEVVREVPVEVVKEVVREVPIEVIKEVVKEVPVEVIKEVVKEVPVEVIKEVLREVPHEVIKEVVKEVPVEVVKEVVREVPVEVVREIVKEVPVEVVREMTQVDEEEMRRLRRRLEELQTAHEQLATMSGRVPVDEKMQALLNMASGVGHVFNNVLAGILGRTQLLLKKAEREKSKDLIAGLSEIEAATRSGIDALTRIQEFSRARPSEAFGRVDLNDVVQRAVEHTRPKWRDEPAARGVRIDLITHFGAHGSVLGVEAELLEALVQLIVNAVDAMPRGGTLTLRTGSGPGHGLISVADTGHGMPEAVKRRAFEPFFSTKGETGLGLGLSVVYGIMTRHAGEASVESEEGTGSTITLRIPTAAAGASAPTPSREVDQAELLVVDDDETVRTALGDLLRGASYSITLAASGLEGIAKVRERETPFDLVVTDLGMPDVPGWEVVEAVKQAEAATPVVIMSGFDRARATRRAKELGVDLVISKPFDLQDFLNAIRGLLLGRNRS